MRLGALAMTSGHSGWSKRLHMDVPLLLMLLVLLAVGLVALYSASGSTIHVQRQGMRIGIGLLAMLVLAQLDPRTIRFGSLPIYIISLIFLVMVLYVGTGAMGATRWLGIPGLFMFQPAEIMKLAAPAMIAWFLTQRELPPRLWHVLASLVLCLFPAFLVVQQPDLGTALLIIASGLFVVFLAGLSWLYIAGGLLAAVGTFPALWLLVLRDYQRQRILTLFDPEKDPLGSGWNIIQSQTAIGSGGWDGKGYLMGTQSQLNFLPESHTDFIVAVMAEEFGFIGMALLLCLYLAIAARGLIIAINGRDTFGRLLAGGLTLTFFIYVFVNVGMVSGILPVVGVPLPLVSYGGTSIVTLLAGFGIIMSVATHKKL
ncbi:rod shape-determining protein RodA [Natronospirillum operosum]|uniref:Peptidoglycan glycosyltransferase MrdB n=1 Tax=Natronospirillum operosum TaxID=2759953 RepID=A0A4Z0W6X9_9GAMM|nr:rod shape-determining protein RodA [Natronospirillum operosum]TGG92965.1 rod shape-determining protein RodA [Natronospirillum operosum]